MSEKAHAKVPGSETSENGYLGVCWCQFRGDAWPCRDAARRPAPALTAEEARTIARFDAAEVPPEVVAAGERVERVARAMRRVPPGEDFIRRLAAAAIAALPPQEPFDLDAACQPVTRKPQSTRTFRAALASPAPAPQEPCLCGALPGQPHDGDRHDTYQASRP